MSRLFVENNGNDNKNIQGKHDNQKNDKNKSNGKFKENILKNDNKKNNINKISHDINNNLVNGVKVQYVYGSSKFDSLINSIDNYTEVMNNYSRKIDKVIDNSTKTNLMLDKLINILIEEKSKEKEKKRKR